MNTFYFYLTRKQIVVVWQDADGRHSRAYSKSEKGERSAMNKMNALLSVGYTRTEPPRDWFADLVASVREDTTCPECDGDGRYPVDGYGDCAGGWAETCETCRGTGRVTGVAA